MNLPNGIVTQGADEETKELFHSSHLGKHLRAADTFRLALKDLWLRNTKVPGKQRNVYEWEYLQRKLHETKYPRQVASLYTSLRGKVLNRKIGNSKSRPKRGTARNKQKGQHERVT